MTLSADAAVILPELVLALGGMALLMLGVFMGDRSARLMSYLAVALFVAVGFAVTAGTAGAAFSGAFVADAFSGIVKILVLIGAALVLIMGQSYFVREKMDRFEFPVLVVFSVVGMMIMASAADFSSSPNTRLAMVRVVS